MSDNLAIWQSLERTDPKHVKEITGKSYKGNSPRPQYVIYRLTERFGPVGLGFGWEVVSDGYVDGIPQPEGVEKVHECRIRFWWREGGERYCVDSYGATKALYKTNKGFWTSDEDAAKKSLTDAITKAASWLGVAADIFMGRWDDNKYVAELKEEARKEAAPQQPAEKPKLSDQAAASGPRDTQPTPLDLFIGKLDKARNLNDLQAIWTSHSADLRGNSGAIRAKDRMKGILAQQPLEMDRAS